MSITYSFISWQKMLFFLFSVLLPWCGLGIPLDDYDGDSGLYNPGLYQGDIAGIDMTQDRNAIVDHTKLWPGGVVHYEIDPAVDFMRDKIMAAIKEYHDKTCVRFVPRTSNVVDYIRIVDEPGCWSFVGVQGGLQKVSLGQGCSTKPTSIHELMHAIGFWHEQSRSDRDDYLEIIWENIMEGTEFNFDKLDYFDNNLLGVEFDYESIMLYGETAFSKDYKSITMKPRKAGVKLIPVYTKSGFSTTDVIKINRLYECFGEVRPPRPEPPGFYCDFEDDNCGIANQENMLLFWYRSNIRREGSRGYYMGLTATQGGNGFARLITPFVKVYGREKGCLRFRYYLEGSAARNLKVTQQGQSTSEVWETNVADGRWKETVLNLNLNGDTRFFVEASTSTDNTQGVIAIDEFSLAIRSCN
ncbi:astacin-like metalloprotease toxin 1 [Limulus polyphemus]|uniref:Metalloendopeptidase n=1 Tax=Limulus polyphemus TaxID=6850 RepID=A0ABM1SCG8_LIMPO|nr:astacin-like metalloprotease toxin 1 [Limulus polyphemus]